MVSSAQTREGRRATVVCLLGALVRFASAYRCACLLVVSTRADMAVVCCRRGEVREKRGREGGVQCSRGGNEGCRDDDVLQTDFMRDSPNTSAPSSRRTRSFNPNSLSIFKPPNQRRYFQPPNPIPMYPHGGTGIPCCVHCGAAAPRFPFSFGTAHFSFFFPFRT